MTKLRLLPLWWSALGVALLLQHADDAHAQTISMAIGGGSGLERGVGHGASTGKTSPIFLDAAVRLINNEEPRVTLGGSLRMEVERNGGVALVPRAELRHLLPALEIRPGIGFPIFVTPETMLGPEVSCTFRKHFDNGFGGFLTIAIDAFIGGSDLPAETSVLMFNAYLGGDLEL